MSDTMFRGMTRDGFIKFSILSARTIVERARVIHNASPVVTAALGRALIATSILGCDLKDEGSSLTMRISGDGPLGDIIAVSDNLGNVRGWCRNPLEDLPLRESDGKLDVAGIVGTTGTLSIVRDFGLGEPYTGQIDLVSGEIAEDVTAYLAVSEQIPSACALGVLVDRDYSVKAAGGFVISLMPGAPEDVVSRLERAIAAMRPITTCLADGMDAKAIINAVLNDFDVVFLEESEVAYRCFCSRERVTRALVSMGRDELILLLEEQGKAQITCQFCDNVYEFDYDDIKALTQ